MALSEVLTTLSTLNRSVGSLADSVASVRGELSTLRWMVPLIVAVGMGVIGVIVALK